MGREPTIDNPIPAEEKKPQEAVRSPLALPGCRPMVRDQDGGIISLPSGAWCNAVANGSSAPWIDGIWDGNDWDGVEW